MEEQVDKYPARRALAELRENIVSKLPLWWQNALSRPWYPLAATILLVVLLVIAHRPLVDGHHDVLGNAFANVLSKLLLLIIAASIDLWCHVYDPMGRFFAYCAGRQQQRHGSKYYYLEHWANRVEAKYSHHLWWFLPTCQLLCFVTPYAVVGFSSAISPSDWTTTCNGRPLLCLAIIKIPLGLVTGLLSVLMYLAWYLWSVVSIYAVPLVGVIRLFEKGRNSWCVLGRGIQLLLYLVLDKLVYRWYEHMETQENGYSHWTSAFQGRSNGSSSGSGKWWFGTLWIKILTEPSVAVSIVIVLTSIRLTVMLWLSRRRRPHV